MTAAQTTAIAIRQGTAILQWYMRAIPRGPHIVPPTDRGVPCACVSSCLVALLYCYYILCAQYVVCF